MFNAYVADRGSRKGRKVIWGSFTLAVAVVASGVVGMVVHSFWSVDRLTPRYRSTSFVSALPPPAPPPAAAAPAAPKSTRVQKTKRTAEVVQPVVTEKAPTEPDTASDAVPDGSDDGQQGGVPGGDPNGTPGGDPNGTPGGDPNGVPFGTGTLPDLEPKRVTDDPPAPKVVQIEAIEGQRTAGREQIPLPRDAKLRATKEGNRRLLAVVKLCLDASGAPDKIQLMKSTGYPDADATILAEMRDWRYRPYTVNGRAVPVCSAVTFNYIIED